MYGIPGWRTRVLNASFRQWIESSPTVSRAAGGLKAGYEMTAAQNVPVTLSAVSYEVRPLSSNLARTGLTRTIVRVTSAYASITAPLCRQLLGIMTKPSELPVGEISAYAFVIDLLVVRELGARVLRDPLRCADRMIR
jgi:hypothetical protein